MRLMSVSSLYTAVVSDSAMSDGEEAGMYEVATVAPSPGMDSDEPGHVAHKSACDSAQLPEDEESDADDGSMYGAGAKRTAQCDADLYVKGKSKTKKGSTYRFRF